MQRNKVILVDENDNAIGEMDKMEAHVKGALHRAFSIFIFNSQDEMLIHQRAQNKYHGGGLWTNACCSHPQWGENTQKSALERLNFEMGLDCDVAHQFSFLYESPVENNLIEHEYDHVFVGITDKEPIINHEEVIDYKWINTEDLKTDILKNPNNYTVWFKMALPKILNSMKPPK